MTARRAAGYTLLALPVAVILSSIGVESGWLVAVGSLVMSAVLLGLIFLGLKLIEDDQ